MSAEIVYYTDNALDPRLAALCRRQLLAAVGARPIQTVALNRAAGFGIQTVMFGERGILQMLRQIEMGLKRAKAEVIFLAEHDVLYHPSHFEFMPARADTFYYNINVWHVAVGLPNCPDGHAVYYDAQQVSGLCAYRELLLDFYRQRIEQFDQERFDRHYEPGLKQTVGGQRVENRQSTYPNLDIRHGGNLTPSKWSRKDFRNAKYARGWREADELPGWGRLADLFKA